MEKLNIATINMQGYKRKESNTKQIADIINKNEIDFFGAQETIKIQEDAIKKLLDGYSINGKHRCGDLFVNMPYNEGNPGITNQKVIESNTIWLPFIANNFGDLKESITKMSIMPRIATTTIIEDKEYRNLCMINTHLDYQIPSIQIRQLETLKKLILKYNQDYEIFLTGDFNMELGNKMFEEFMSDMKDVITRVDVNQSTWNGKNGESKTVDHVFIPNNEKWSITDAGIIDLTGASDHNAVYANLKRR